MATKSTRSPRKAPASKPAAERRTKPEPGQDGLPDNERPLRFAHFSAAREAAERGVSVSAYIIVDSLAKAGKKTPAIVDGSGEPVMMIGDMADDEAEGYVQQLNMAFEHGARQGAGQARINMLTAMGFKQTEDGIGFKPFD